MDQKQVGKKLAALRRRAGLTQQELGNMVGVTNKTVSRWENGHYLPDLALFPELGRIFSVTVDDLLSDEEVALPQEPEQVRDPFSQQERRLYWENKWRREHRWQLVLLPAFFMGSIFLCCEMGQYWPVTGAVVLVVFVLVGRHNAMAAYVEQKLYD